VSGIEPQGALGTQGKSKEELDEITSSVIQAGIDVHRALGPGLLESAYQACLAFDLVERGLRVERERELPVVYRGNRVDCGFRIDLLVEDAVVVELKAVERLLPIHEAQLLSYLRLSGCCVGLLMNFNVRMLREGIRRLVHRYPGDGPPTSSLAAVPAVSAVQPSSRRSR
jgi:GxxExxY protein